MTAAIHYDPGDLKILAELEQRHFWFGSRRRIIVDALRRWFGDARNYLEIGCGTGYNARGIARAFPQWQVVASDPLAERAGSLRVDALDIPFEAAFDVVGAYDVIEHIEDHACALGEFRKACRPAGGILLTVPQHPWLWSTADTHAQHCRRYTRGALVRLLGDCGFDVIGVTSFQFVNLPALFARSRWLRWSGSNPRPKAPPAPLNWLLEKGMEVDRWMIRSGVALPLGGSLLVAARRVD